MSPSARNTTPTAPIFDTIAHADYLPKGSRARRLPLGNLAMSYSAYQLAAMRFTAAAHGLIVVSSSDADLAGIVMAFHSTNGGQTWDSEVVPVAAGAIYLSRDGRLLTVISEVNQLTLLRFE